MEMNHGDWSAFELQKQISYQYLQQIKRESLKRFFKSLANILGNNQSLLNVHSRKIYKSFKVHKAFSQADVTSCC